MRYESYRSNGYGDGYDNADPKTRRPNYNDGFDDSDSEEQEIYSNSNRGNYPRKRKPRKRKKHKKYKVLKTIFFIIALILIIFGIYSISVLSRVNYSDENPDSTIISASGEALRSEKGAENILIFGADNHAEDEYGRSDSIILLTIDRNHKKLKQTSFMRDIYIYIPDYGYDKLNAAYAYGGPSLAAETIEYNFGIKIDRYIVIDFSSFTEIIDAIGGITLELTAEEIDYINWQCWRNHQVETRNELDINDYIFYDNDNGTEVAKVHLNGRQALWYARDRDSSGSDFDRTQRQRTVINTILSQMKDGNVIGLLQAGYSASPYVTTNMQPFTLIMTAFRTVEALNYEKLENRIPSNDNYYDDWANGGQVLCISDYDTERERLYDFIFEEE